MKKFLRILFPITAVAAALIFSGCGAISKKQAENRMVNYGEFVAKSQYEETALYIKSDKTYTLYIHSYETEAMETYEGTWSHVLTYKFKYTVTHDAAELIKTTESVTWHIFKLDGYTDRGEQGYFIFKTYNGIIHCTDEEMNESHFEQYKNKYGLVSVPGWEVKVKSQDS